MSSNEEKVEVIYLDEKEKEALIRFLNESSVPEDSKKTMILIITQYFKLFQIYRSSRWKLSRFLFRFFGPKTEKEKPSDKEKDSALSKKKSDDDPNDPPSKDPAGGEQKSRPGGRKSHDQYDGADRVRLDHESLSPGDTCPCCQKHRLYEYGLGSVLVLRGQPPVGATHYEPQQLRCSGCHYTQTAKLPDSINKDESSANAAVAIYNYGAGLPFYRLEGLQKLFGVPLSDSKQWTMVKSLFDSVWPVFLALSECASQGTHFFNDDTGQRILSEKKKLQTSVVVSLFENHKITLYYSGYKDAGQNLEDLLRLRESQALPLQMSDASSRSLMRELEAVICYCLDHARRNIFQLKNIFKVECTWILDKLKAVYKNEKDSKGLDPEMRLLFHQERTLPVMNEINEYLETKLENKEVEPNSELGRAFSYFLNHWNYLTQFLRVKGAFLSNGEAERAIKKVALKRKNSQVYKTLFGAFVGDILMSIIETGRNTQINVMDYLTQLQLHERKVSENPLKWLPWNYQLNFSTS